MTLPQVDRESFSWHRRVVDSHRSIKFERAFTLPLRLPRMKWIVAMHTFVA
ncbi:hypothetical protein BSLA_03f0907 [Burkholderia stabilis]|nr:hypothetical protein BSLA_03f0907 [Burkholderia stabilis]